MKGYTYCIKTTYYNKLNYICSYLRGKYEIDITTIQMSGPVTYLTHYTNPKPICKL